MHVHAATDSRSRKKAFKPPGGSSLAILFQATSTERTTSTTTHVRLPPVLRCCTAFNAAAVLVKKFNAVNARIGDRSIPPNGGMMPRNKFKYGSQIVANGYTICCGAAGNHVTINLPINRVLYMFNVENNPEVKTTSTAESPGIIAPKNLFVPRMGTMISFIVFLLFLLLLLCLLLYCAALMLAQNTAFAFFASLFSEMFFLAELKPDRAACRNSFRGVKRNDVDDDEEDDATAIALPNCAIGEVIDGSIRPPCSSFVVIIVLLLLLIMLDVLGKCSVSYSKSEEVRC